MKLLIVDDEKLIRDVIKEYAIQENYTILEASDGNVALNIIKNEIPDIIVLDIMMPNMDGLTCYQEIKKIKNIPTIILSARGEEYDKLTGFDLGIDDYLTKPFSPKELMARLKAIIKRANPYADKFNYQTLEYDIQGRMLMIDNNEIKLTPKEYKIFEYLIKNKNIAIAREQLLTALWGYDFFGDDRTIDTHIKMLRSNLKQYRNLIETVRSIGYKLVIKDDQKE